MPGWEQSHPGIAVFTDVTVTVHAITFFNKLYSTQ